MKATAIVLVALTSTAYADAKKEVEALVRAEAQIIDDSAARPARTSDAVVVYPVHQGDTRMIFYGGWANKIVHKVDKLVVVVADAHAAWFHAVVDGSYERSNCNSTGDDCKKPTHEHATWRLSGVARDDHGWKLAAVMWSRAIPDADLFKLGEVGGVVGGAKGEPDAIEPISAVERWLRDKGLGKNISSSATAIANGTAPAESGQGPAAAKLAKAWDGLDLKPVMLAGKRWGSLAFVYGDVTLTSKKKAVTMKLGVVVARENENWRWVAINFAPPDEP
jgi:hypothetical protein